MYTRHFITRLIALLLLLSPTITSSLTAQFLNHVQGEVLVQLHERPAGQSVKSWFSAQQDGNGEPLGLHYKSEISRHSKIYLLRFDHAEVDEQLVLAELRRNPAVVNAQFNHYVTTRATVPDDPEFFNQWQYINNGQNGGTVGADIDADLAWDYTTGGITAAGDTIVACIIDDGIDSDHPDIAPNLWVNRAEIPDNGIDDDNNGYVDDYRGWDTGSLTDGVYDGGGHGTPVAGIVGARGNNGIGVAGTNWNVKLMIVQGGTGVESEVLRAYGYPLDARMRYNATDGAEGAFVVSTNASWGVDFGNPDDAPLWCAFYDTLGVHGILNCGATINGNVDVDANGDLPTACSSDYLISVTNMNRNDIKVTGAGFGATTIDLGAFGAETWTTQFGGGYGGFGGTSGATPHVTGTIALLYSLPCGDLISAAKDNPGAVALLMKQAILEGVDFNESLQGITTTGGRLNMHNSVLRVLEQCGSCLPPLSATATVSSDTQAVIDWSLLSDTVVNQLDLRYRVSGTTDWILINDVTAPLTLEGLTGCTLYEYQLQATCDTSMSDFTRSYEFTTLGCCENPENLIAAPQNDSLILFYWDTVYAATAYQLETRVAGAMDWDTTLTTEDFIRLEGLEACTTIEYRFKIFCGETGMTDYTPVASASTSGCGACIDEEYCSTPDISIEDEWIGQVVIGDFTNSSGAGENGYTDFTVDGPSAEMNGGGTYQVTLTPTYSGTTYAEGWAIFIDLNQDGDFADGNERLLTIDPVVGEVTGSFTLPLTAPEGYTRMRVSMLYDIVPNACATNEVGFGEIEDYCVTIGEPLPVCALPIALAQDTSQGLSLTEALVSWQGEEENSTYTLRYRIQGTAPWTAVSTMDTSLLLSDLSPCSNYEVQISVACPGGIPSTFSASVSVNTLCPAICAIPANLTQLIPTDQQSDSTVIMTWESTAEGTVYTLRYRPDNVLEWAEITTTETILEITGLDSCAAYEVQISAACGDGEPSAFSEGVLAQTACISASRFPELNIAAWSVAPNPARERVSVQYRFHQRPEQLTASLLSQFGRELMRVNTDPGLTGSLQLDIAHLPSGVYYLRLETEAGGSRVRKLVKL